MNRHKPDDVFINKVTQQLDESIDDLDEDISQRLASRRQQAVTLATSQKSNLPNSIFNFVSRPAAVFSLASLLVISLSIALFDIDSRTIFNTSDNVLLQAGYDVNDDDVIAEYELLNDLEFISWLVVQENEHSDDENNAS
jgi:hypothetical protein